MSIKPIDLQTNIAQIHEVAKGEQGRSAAVVEGQHRMEKKSGEESKQVSERLDENKKAEKTAIRREDERKKKKERKKLAKDDEMEMADLENEEKLMKDEKIGRMIDVKR